eukprot:CAMPEP_0202463918 /NCGR_PEP_ID=MMETSP1360-20130828/59921_1 /ASSEMBLY_ACC=CAM_ASM_000848 /TAXON_ID=515479 /ORGANISM="Licmophora paradoxa, Strain CCMP2313" /LENGTH=48 /DNA_ID= /DNA_START= /DNA_END= /DNA_ORIENTATION=
MMDRIRLFPLWQLGIQGGAWMRHPTPPAAFACVAQQFLQQTIISNNNH